MITGNMRRINGKRKIAHISGANVHSSQDTRLIAAMRCSSWISAQYTRHQHSAVLGLVYFPGHITEIISQTVVVIILLISQTVKLTMYQLLQQMHLLHKLH